MGRRQAREGAVKLIYQMEINEDFTQEALDIYFSNFEFDKEEKDYIIDSVNTIVGNMSKIDDLISNHSQGWNINRIAKVDLAILRIAIYEALYRHDIPVQVAINEAIENSKKYSNPDAYKYINGVLGGIVRSKD